jgi:two-component system phosphate regulon sensor histidine kinase PhoR
MSAQNLVVLPTMPIARRVPRPAAASAKSGLLAIVVHELRQPLTVIRGQLQLGRRQIGRDQVREREAVDVAIAQVDRMDTLLTALLDAETFVTNGLGVTVETFDLVPVVTRAIARHEEGTARSISLRSPQAVAVRGDAERTAEILDNLLGIARKYSPANAPIDVYVVVSGTMVQICVADHGVGVPAAEQGRLFRPFYRASTTRDIPGTGLGLHLSRQLAERQGGRLWLSASSTAGSAFSLELPVAIDHGKHLAR